MRKCVRRKRRDYRNCCRNRSGTVTRPYNACGISIRDEHARGCHRARRRPAPGRQYELRCGRVCNPGRHCSMTAIPDCTWRQSPTNTSSTMYIAKGFEDDEGFRSAIAKTCASSSMSCRRAPGQLSPGRANARRYALTARPVGRGSLRARSPGRRSPTTLMLPIAAARCPTRLALPSFGLILHCTRRRLSGPGFMAACRLHAKNLFAQNRRTTS